MDGTGAQQTARMRLPALIAHVAQIVLAIAVLGLAAYGVDYISYNVLIYSLVVTICSLGVSSWMIVSRKFLAKFDNTWVSLGLHAWMLVFWIVNLGLTANLAHEWHPQCSYTSESGKICSSYVVKRDTTFHTYFGALVASAVLIGLQVLLWIGTTTLLALDLKRRRSTVSQVPTDGPTPRFSADSQATEGDFEKQSNIFDNVSAAPTRDHAEPVLPPASPDIEGEQVEPYQPYVAGNQPSHLTIPGPARMA
ncbi:hypothetical protein BU25DRAFT_492428 [Macroventuria anomochaeta]|uniref:Uncharacterized protein n=1 Tax=Macroventuria anomochaeta TaxID=301207 RepID=A0ACB6RVC2_9PLEO|nr:uncharacterized protein BU25DRAFT_492428 [Macroventuria anomochaeta]KAF2625871.1 hypothetical protein BU25DRAFT_492428 [Macroventuria anomochaeta]